jgi:hypothetical protein
MTVTTFAAVALGVLLGVAVAYGAWWLGGKAGEYRDRM